MSFLPVPYLVNWCENALDLNNDKLIVISSIPVNTNCQWLISAVDDKDYVVMEFQNIEVRIAELNYLP